MTLTLAITLNAVLAVALLAAVAYVCRIPFRLADGPTEAAQVRELESRGVQRQAA